MVGAGCEKVTVDLYMLGGMMHSGSGEGHDKVWNKGELIPGSVVM